MNYGGQEVLKLKTYYQENTRLSEKIIKRSIEIDVSSCVSINLQVTSILSSDRISTVTHLIGHGIFISQDIAHKHMYLLEKLSERHSLYHW